jgi:hypothetical protein
MKFWKKISVVFVLAIAVLLMQGTDAQAATYKFTFTGGEANGFFIYIRSIYMEFMGKNFYLLI